jgi:uncharacterized protein YecE (DUF72 family)
MNGPRTQQSLFELTPRQIEPAPVREEQRALAAALPESVHLGAMTWSYRGWVGSVYGRDATEQELARYGLTAYVKQPLLRMAELDRTYYEPLTMSSYRAYAEQVPDEFRFLVKGHELCTIERFPMHPRYGERRGRQNPMFLDAEYATQRVIEPLLEGLGEKLFALLWQFSPRSTDEPQRFAAELHEFLRQLPKSCLYAVELRNRELLTPEYAAALTDSGAIHCHNAWTTTSSVLAQARALPAAARRPLLIRWLLRPGERFEAANARYLPFDKLVSEDPDTRQQIASLVALAHAHGVPSYVLVDNKAEGSAPESIALLARALVQHLGAPPQ